MYSSRTSKSSGYEAAQQSSTDAHTSPLPTPLYRTPPAHTNRGAYASIVRHQSLHLCLYEYEYVIPARCGRCAVLFRIKFALSTTNTRECGPAHILVRPGPPGYGTRTSTVRVRYSYPTVPLTCFCNESSQPLTCSYASTMHSFVLITYVTVLVQITCRV